MVTALDGFGGAAGSALSTTPVGGYSYVTFGADGYSYWYQNVGGSGLASTITASTSDPWVGIDIGWPWCTIELDVQADGDFIAFCGGNSGNYYRVVANHDSTTPGRDYVIIQRVTNGVATEVAGGLFRAASGAVVTHLSVTVKPNSISVGMNRGAYQGVAVSPTYQGTYVGFGHTIGARNLGSHLDNFVVTSASVAPNAAIQLSPVGNPTVSVTAPLAFRWRFSDNDPGDSQSAYQLRYRVVGAGSWTTTAAVAVPDQQRIFPAGTFTSGSQYEWQVLTADQSGLWGPWSTSAFFTGQTPPAGPTVTNPTSGSTVIASQTVAWSTSGQQAYQIRRVADLAGAADTSTVYWDSGAIVDTITRSTTVAFPVNSRDEHLQVRTELTNLWSSWVDVPVTVAWLGPPMPVATADPDDTQGSVLVAVRNPDASGAIPETLFNTVVASADGLADRVVEAQLVKNGSTTDQTPRSGYNYTYWVTATSTTGTTSFAAAVEVSTAAVQGSASLALTATTTAAGSTTNALALRVTITASGTVTTSGTGRASGAALAMTATVTAAGTVNTGGTGGGALLPSDSLFPSDTLLPNG